MVYDFLWSDPEPAPDNLNGSGSGSGQKVRIRPDPAHFLHYFHNRIRSFCKIFPCNKTSALANKLIVEGGGGGMGGTLTLIQHTCLSIPSYKYTRIIRMHNTGQKYFCFRVLYRYIVRYHVKVKTSWIMCAQHPEKSNKNIVYDWGNTCYSVQ